MGCCDAAGCQRLDVFDSARGTYAVMGGAGMDSLFSVKFPRLTWLWVRERMEIVAGTKKATAGFVEELVLYV